jgi:2-keto-3-deoxy-L-rhamnonate aldolase RhmA
MVIVQVETPAAIEAVGEMTEIPEIDVIFIGPTDLSLALGHPGDFQHPKVQDAFNRIIDVVGKSDKALGVLATTTESSLAWRAKGARYIMTVFEALMGPPIRTYLKTVREG